MAKIPEDLRTALETLSLLNEKFLAPLSRLPQALRTCAESYGRIEDANKKLEMLQQAIAQEEQKTLQQEERSQTRLKTLGEQLDTLQVKHAQELEAHEQKRMTAQQLLEQLESECAAKYQKREALGQELKDETKRLEELRERIRKAQTLEV